MKAAFETEDQIRLVGVPGLSDYLRFVRRNVVGGDKLSRNEIIDEWRICNDHYGILEEDEAGLADQIEILPLPAEMEEAAAKLAEQAVFQSTFDKVQTNFAMVELDKIVVTQRHVTLPFIQAHADKMAHKPSGAELFNFCQPVERRDPEVTVRQLDSNRYIFLSDSMDLRFHDAALLRPDQIVNHDETSPISAALALIVGHGSNFFSVVRSDNRVVLHNGYHRATALRMAGYTHAPAIIQTVDRRDELNVVGNTAVVDDPVFYFRAKRPPLLKDFFDPMTSKVKTVRRRRKMIEVSFSAVTGRVEDF